jgi:DNA-binding protein HU-beta
MRKRELIRAISQDTGYSQAQIADILSSLIKNVKNATLDGGKVTLAGFGVFFSRKTTAREFRNPMNGQIAKVPERTKLCFRSSKKF